MSTGSIRTIILPLLLIFITANFVFSPLEAQNTIPIEEENFIKTEPLTKKIYYFTITGYSSSPDETDDTPWITAYNTLTKDGIVASNDLPFGTKIKIPQLFGDKIFVVEDRLNERIRGVIDIWFPSKESALNFGIYYNVLVEVLE
ncbi:MAG: hypothetical protein C4347_00555 [Patescibacteria group bacterium]